MILKKPRNKSETNISEKTYRDITKWLNKNDLCLLEADKGRATCIISKKQVHKMVEQELNKPEDTRKSRSAINKKLAELKLKSKRSKNKTRTFQFKTKCTKNTKSQTNIENTQRSFKNTFDY